MSPYLQSQERALPIRDDRAGCLRRLTEVLLLALTLPILAGTTASNNRNESIVEQRVLRAIDFLFSCPGSITLGPETALVVRFADESDRISIELRPQFLELSGGKNLNALMLAYYVAGAVKFDLEHPAQAREATADVPSGIRGELLFYRAYRAGHPNYSSALLEKLDTIETAGQLDRFVHDSLSVQAR